MAIPIFGTTKTGFYFNKRTGLRQSCLALVPSAAHLCPRFSEVAQATHKSMAIEGHCVSSKSSSRVRDGDEGVAGRNGGE